MGKKAIRTERLETTIDGVIYTGSRTIEGTRKLFQTIYYSGKSRYDGHAYQSDSSMETWAKVILGELVRESKNSA